MQQDYFLIFLIVVYSFVVLLIISVPIIKKLRNYINTKRHSSYIDNLYKYGDELCQKGMYNQAIAEYQKAYSEDTTNKYYNYAMGMAYYGLKNYDKAAYFLLEAVANLPSFSEEIYLTMIDIYAECNKPEACAEMFDILISTFKDDSKKYKKYQEQKIYYLENIDKIKAKNKIKDAKILYDKALESAKCSKFKDAELQILKALELVPDNEDYINLFKEVRDLYQKEVAKVDELYKKVETLKEEKQYQQALNEVDKAEGIAKKHGIGIFKLSKLKTEIEKQIEIHKDAKKLYDLAVKSLGWKDYNCALINIQDAIGIEPENSEYKSLLVKIQQEIKDASVEVSELLNDFEVAKNNGDVKKAMYFINEAIKSARDKKLDTSKLTKAKNDYVKYTENIEKAQSSYNRAMAGYKYKNYENTIKDLKNAVSLAPDNLEYQNTLQKIKSEYEKICAKADKHYLEAKDFYKKEDLKNAKSSINKALKLLQIQYYIDLSNKIEDKQQKLINEQKAETLYNEALSLYNSSNHDYDKIFNLLDKAIDLYPKKVYKDLRGKIKHDRDIIVAEKFYEEAKICFSNNDFDKALSFVKESIKLSPSNKIYIDLKQKIDWEQKEFQKRQEAEECYKSAIEYYNDGDFSEAIEYLEEALDLQPNNETYQNLLDRAEEGKIDIMTCTKNALLTLDFINEEQAESIIQARNEGLTWTDYQKFAEQFNIMPHQWTEVEEKIIFPLKQASRYGRKLDA